MAKVYAVKVGRETGVFNTWAECEAQVKGFSGAQYKSFKSLEEAEKYLGIQKEKVPTVSVANDRVDIYVDGSYHEGRYSWSFVVYRDGAIYHYDCGVGTNSDAATMNNVAGELAAAMRAAKWSKTNQLKAVIHHDYQGISSWVDGSWKAKNKMTQAYREFMQDYRDMIQFNKVAGHSGIEGNELADKLAREALGI